MTSFSPSRFFCPHVSYPRQTSRHKRSSNRSYLSDDDTCSSITVTNMSTITSSSSGVATGDEYSSCQNSSFNHDGSGEPAELLLPSEHHPRGTSLFELKKEFICEDCYEQSNSDLSSSSQILLPNHLWKCLEPKCKRMLCGKQGQNHSQQHFQEFPHHFVQENFANKRIWCNECNMEVFLDQRNRRSPPAVWGPPVGVEEEPPRGLFNIGNTCFMNAALQCMAAVKPLNSFILGNSCSFKGKQVANSYLWFLSEMWSRDSQGYSKGVMPSRLLHAVRAAHPIFRGFQQHDTQEFLRLFMDTLAEETRVPHFILEDVEMDKQSEAGSDDGTMSVDSSETDSFETCDSGNASEETMSTDTPCNGEGNNNNNNNNSSNNNNKQPSQDVKILMKSIVSEIFDGQVEGYVQCLSCKQISSRLEVFQDLSLPIPTRDELTSLRTSSDRYENDNDGRNNPGWIGWFMEWVKSFFWGPAPTLEDCFSAFFSSDELKGKNMYSCEKCQKLRNGVKRCSLYRLPEILCVHLKRFRMYEYSGGMGFSGKVSQYVQFPLEGLDLSPFLNKECPSQVTTYRLMGAICHIGSFLGGHYTAYIRRDEEWYLCDDSRVVQVSPETVSDCEAYVLFYQKYDLPDQVREVKQEVLDSWDSADANDKDMKFHLLSRKWLTRFVWGEEPGPIDNSDAVCPHGFIAPYDNVNLGTTWVPEPVWEILMERFGGGPDLVHPEECGICLPTWKRHLKSNPDKERNSRLYDGI